MGSRVRTARERVGEAKDGEQPLDAHRAHLVRVRGRVRVRVRVRASPNPDPNPNQAGDEYGGGGDRDQVLGCAWLG